MTRPLMPKATAIWLCRNTSLTEEQIGDFCGMHHLEVSLLAKQKDFQEQDPTANDQLTYKEIEKCQNDPNARLQLNSPLYLKKIKKNYTPRSKRVEVAHAILWTIKYYPNVTDSKICTLLSTTKTTVQNIREGKHWNMKNLTPKDPVVLGLCSKESFQTILGVTYDS